MTTVEIEPRRTEHSCTELRQTLKAFAVKATSADESEPRAIKPKARLDTAKSSITLTKSITQHAIEARVAELLRTADFGQRSFQSCGSRDATVERSEIGAGKRGAIQLGAVRGGNLSGGNLSGGNLRGRSVKGCNLKSGNVRSDKAKGGSAKDAAAKDVESNANAFSTVTLNPALFEADFGTDDVLTGTLGAGSHAARKCEAVNFNAVNSATATVASAIEAPFMKLRLEEPRIGMARDAAVHRAMIRGGSHP